MNKCLNHSSLIWKETQQPNIVKSKHQEQADTLTIKGKGATNPRDIDHTFSNFLIDIWIQVYLKKILTLVEKPWEVFLKIVN